MFQIVRTLSDQKALSLDSYADRADIDEDIEYTKVFLTSISLTTRTTVSLLNQLIW